jgi:hypothetical protein
LNAIITTDPRDRARAIRAKFFEPSKPVNTIRRAKPVQTVHVDYAPPMPVKTRLAPAVELAIVKAEPEPLRVPSRLNMGYILAHVCREYEISAHDVKSARRTRNLIEPRQVWAWLAKSLLPVYMPMMGKYMGGRDHTTMLHSVRMTDARMATDADFAARVLRLKARIEAAV